MFEVHDDSVDPCYFTHESDSVSVLFEPNVGIGKTNDIEDNGADLEN